MDITTFVAPLEKSGFVALSAVLLLVLVTGGGWVIKRLLDVVSHNSMVIAGCTSAITKNNELSTKSMEIQSQILERIITIDARCKERC